MRPVLHVAQVARRVEVVKIDEDFFSDD